MKKIYLLLVTALLGNVAFAQNVGIGTNTPVTKLDINGALSARITAVAAAASVTIPDNVTLFRLTNTTGGGVTTLSLLNPKDGQYLTIFNEDDGAATLNGYTIPAGTSASPGVANFINIGGLSTGWKAAGDNNTGSNAFTAGNGLSWSGTTLNSVWSANGTDIYNNNNSGKVGIGTSTPSGTLDVQGGTATGSNNGSNINLTAQNGGGSGTNGGIINITAGNGTSGGFPGNVNINSGTSPSAGNVNVNASGGNVNIAAGSATQNVSIGNNGNGGNTINLSAPVIKAPNIGTSGTNTSTLTLDGTGQVSTRTLNSVSFTGEVDPKIGALTNNVIPKWSSGSTKLVDGSITDDGTNTVLGNGGYMAVNGNDIRGNQANQNQVNLSSNGSIRAKLDIDNNSSSDFAVQNGSGSNVLTVTEGGNVSATGNGDFNGDMTLSGTSARTFRGPVGGVTDYPLNINSASGIDVTMDDDNDGTASDFNIKKGAGTILFNVNETAHPMVYPYDVNTGNTGGIRFRELAANGSNYVGLRAPDVIGTDKMFTLPATDGGNGNYLKTDGSGQLGWGTDAGGSVTSVATGTGLTGGPITTTGTIALSNTAVTPGAYTNTNITVDAQGRITAASNGTAGTVTGVTASNGLTSSGGATPNITLGGTLTAATTIANAGFNLNITGTGNVGIGATTVGARLHIGGSNQAFRIDYDGSNNYFGSLRWSGLQLGNNGANRIVAGRTSTGGLLDFYVNNTNDAADYSITPDGILAMRLNSNGNVGIGAGVTSPNALLQVGTNHSATGPLITMGSAGSDYDAMGTISANEFAIQPYTYFHVIRGYAYTTGNRKFTAADYMMTINSTDVVFSPVSNTTFSTGNVNISSGTLDMGSHKITSVTTPTTGTDAANKAYVDAQLSGLGSGSGVANKLARWTSTTALGTGTTYDDGSSVGIATTGPKRTLNVHGTGALESGQATTITDATVALKLGPTTTRLGTGYYMAGIGFANLWNYSGGSTYDANNHAWIGTRHEDTPGSEHAALVFATNPYTDNAGLPVERMAITNAGNVGIGVQAPQVRLDVRRSDNSDGDAIAFGTQTYFMGRLGENASTNKVYLANTYANNSSFIDFRLQGTAEANSKMIIKGDGTVGVGTTSPLTRFHIAAASGISTFTGATRGIVTVDPGAYTSGNYSNLDFLYTSGSNPDARIGASFTGSGSTLAFGTSNDYSAGITNTAMVINPAGKVGINSTSPTYQTQISGTLNAGYILLGDNNNNNNNTIEFVNGPGSTTYREGWISYYGAGNLGICAGGGNVGIGSTATPTNKLTVTGDMKVLNNLFLVDYNRGALTGIPDQANAGAMAVCGNMTGADAEVDILNASPQVGTNRGFRFWNRSTSGANTEILRLQANANMIAIGYNTFSDRNLKTDIQPLQSSLAAKIYDLKTYTYKFDDAAMEKQKLAHDNKTHFGVMAQELEELYPNLVDTDAKGIKSVNYMELIPVLLETLKEQNARIDVLEKEIKNK